MLPLAATFFFLIVEVFPASLPRRYFPKVSDALRQRRAGNNLHPPLSRCVWFHRLLIERSSLHGIVISKGVQDLGDKKREDRENSALSKESLFISAVLKRPGLPVPWRCRPPGWPRLREGLLPPRSRQPGNRSRPPLCPHPPVGHRG